MTTVARRTPDLSTQLQEIKNDLEIVKHRVSSLDRIAVLTNRDIILEDLRDLVGNSTVRAAILLSTSELISAQDLAQRLHLNPGNLSREINKFTGRKGYINMFTKGRNKFYIRDEKIDLLSLEDEQPFQTLYTEWIRTHAVP